MSNRGDEEVVWFLSEKDGREHWVTPLGPAFEQSWPQSKQGPGSTPTVDGERLYVLGLDGNLACLQARKGSVAVADGRIYYRTEEGTMLLIQPDRQGYIERGRFDQPNRSSQPAWAHPVIANGKLYLRDHEMLLCYDLKK